MFELTTQSSHLPKNNECLRVKRGGYRSTHPVWLVWQATEASEPKQWPRPLLTLWAAAVKIGECNKTKAT